MWWSLGPTCIYSFHNLQLDLIYDLDWLLSLKLEIDSLYLFGCLPLFNNKHHHRPLIKFIKLILVLTSIVARYWEFWGLGVVVVMVVVTTIQELFIHFFILKIWKRIEVKHKRGFDTTLCVQIILTRMTKWGIINHTFSFCFYVHYITYLIIIYEWTTNVVEVISLFCGDCACNCL